MDKYIVTFIIFIVLFIFIVGQCGDNNDEIEGETYEELNSKEENSPVVYEDSVVAESSNIFPNKENSSVVNNVDSSEVHIPESIENPRILIDVPEQILVRSGYTTSYNSYTKNANWVSWHLTKEKTDGPWSRKGFDYIEDNDIIGAKQELDDWSYHNLPIDHGHLCPAGDNKWSYEAMEQSFLLSNMCPQNSNLNRGEWERLEERTRGWANHYGEVFVVAGPIFYSSEYLTIGHNKVGVPDAFFKVILRLGKCPAALGFIFPNEAARHRMQHYLLSVDEVEEKTNMDFFHSLPDDLEKSVESVVDIATW